MPDVEWVRNSPLQALMQPGRHGSSEGDAGISLCEVTDFSLLLAMARRGKGAALNQALKTRFGTATAGKPKAVTADEATLVWTAPDQYFVLTPDRGSSLLEQIEEALSDSASVSEQSDSRAWIRISGKRSRDALAKMIAIDLHPSVFRNGDAAATPMSHIPVHLWRSQGDVFNILVPSGFAVALWRSILDHSAEYGVEITEPVRLI